MERKIGEIFKVDGDWYQCISDTTDDNCNNCFFQKSCSDITGDCSSIVRSDGKSVCFKKLKKVGEPYEFDGHLFQSYRTFEVPIFTENYATVRELGNNSKISIEIKQNKEDMEEKKQCGDTRFRIIARAKEHLFQATNIAEDKKELEVLDSFLLRCWQMGWLKQYEDAEEKKLNLKPFDLQKAREGKPVCTRDGRKARIICFDRVGDFPIVALTDDREYKEEGVNLYDINGKGSNECFDLMMLPERKDGWVNVYNSLGVVTFSHNPYDTKKEALANAKPKDYVDTVKINWEE